MATGTKFNELPTGQYFRWRGRLYRKLPHSSALKIDEDTILDFGHGNVCEPVDRPSRRIALVIQYLEWALLQAHAEASPGAEKVYVEFDLKRKQVITSDRPA